VKYTQEMYEEYRRREDEKAARREQEQREAMEKETARQAWLRDGGSEYDFQLAWPTLRDEGRRRRIVDADRQARESMRESNVSKI
jgi:hypothetical protein